MDRQLIRIERELIKELPPEIQDASIVVAVSEDFQRVHFTNAKRIGSRLVMRRYLIGADQNMRTAAERLQYLRLKDETESSEMSISSPKIETPNSTVTGKTS